MGQNLRDISKNDKTNLKNHGFILGQNMREKIGGKCGIMVAASREKNTGNTVISDHILVSFNGQRSEMKRRSREKVWVGILERKKCKRMD